MSQASVTGPTSQRSRRQTRISAALQYIAILLAFCRAILARPAYTYYRRAAVNDSWFGVEFRLPAPWYRLSPGPIGRAIFLRDKLLDKISRVPTSWYLRDDFANSPGP